MAPPTHPRRPLINKRRAARFAAVQALYQIELNDARASDVVREFVEYRLETILEPIDPAADAVAVDREWFVLIVMGAWKAHETLDIEIDGALADGWSLARCGYLLRATLRAGAFEIAERPDVPVKVVINEYLDIANYFFTESERRFVNAVLDRLASKLRPVETGL